MTDAYTLLDVPRSATAYEIQRAYRRKAMQTHPDRDGGDVAKFQAVKDAFDVLSDPMRRAALDSELAGGAAGGRVMSPDYVAARANREDIGGVCSLCGGEGVVRIAGSIFWTRQPCPKCKVKK